MALGRYAVVRRATDCLEVALEGDIDPQTALCCEREVRAQIALAPSTLRAIVSLSGVTGYQLEAREQLVSLQRCIGAKATQTAYLTDSAPGRALALWVIHTAPGQAVRSFSRSAEAAAWLGIVDPTQSGVREVKNTRRITTRRKLKSANG